MGIKPIFASRVFRERLSKCNKTCMSRIEHSNVFKSIEEEQSFLLNIETAATLENNLNDIIYAINDSALLEQINCKISRHSLWAMFLKAINKTYIFKFKK